VAVPCLSLGSTGGFHCAVGCSGAETEGQSHATPWRPLESLINWAQALTGLPCQSLAFVTEPTHVYHEQLVQFLHSKGTTVYLVNPGRVRKFAEGIGILSKNDVIDADLLARYGLMAKKLIVFGIEQESCL